MNDSSKLNKIFRLCTKRPKILCSFPCSGLWFQLPFIHSKIQIRVPKVFKTYLQFCIFEQFYPSDVYPICRSLSTQSLVIQQPPQQQGRLPSLHVRRIIHQSQCCEQGQEPVRAVAVAAADGDGSSGGVESAGCHWRTRAVAG